MTAIFQPDMTDIIQLCVIGGVILLFVMCVAITKNRESVKDLQRQIFDLYEKNGKLKRDFTEVLKETVKRIRQEQEQVKHKKGKRHRKQHDFKPEGTD